MKWDQVVDKRGSLRRLSRSMSSVFGACCQPSSETASTADAHRLARLQQAAAVAHRLEDDSQGGHAGVH